MRRGNHTALILILPGMIVAGDYLALPAFWLLAFICAACFALAREKPGALRTFYANIAGISLVLALTEVVCFSLIWFPAIIQDEALPEQPLRLGGGREVKPTRYSWEYPGDHVTPQGVVTQTTGQIYALGENDEWLVPGVRVGIQTQHLGWQLYDTVYSHSVHSFRVTRPTPEEFAQSNVDAQVGFFGGSFTFGEAVGDAQTLPAVVQQLGAGRWLAYNFGVGGGGAHEMLALLQGERLDGVMRGKLASAGVYLAIHDHIRRAAGRAGAWQIGRPAYQLDSEEQLRRTGVFTRSFGANQDTGEHGSPFWPRYSAAAYVLAGGLAKSTPKASKEDMRLWASIVKESRRLFAERYHGELRVVIWPGEGGPRSPLVQALVQHHIPFTDLSESLGPDINYLVPVSNHPSPFAYEVVGRALVPLIEVGLF